MNKSYYLRNIPWGLFIFGVIVCSWYFELGDKKDIPSWDFLFFASSALLFPISKKLIEDIAIGCTSRIFWNTGIFKESTAKNSMYVLYYIGCYIGAIPLGSVYIAYCVYKSVIRNE